MLLILKKSRSHKIMRTNTMKNHLKEKSKKFETKKESKENRKDKKMIMILKIRTNRACRNKKPLKRLKQILKKWNQLLKKKKKSN